MAKGKEYTIPVEGIRDQEDEEDEDENMYNVN